MPLAKTGKHVVKEMGLNEALNLPQAVEKESERGGGGGQMTHSRMHE